MQKMKSNKWIIAMGVMIALIMIARFILPMFNQAKPSVSGTKLTSITVSEATYKNVIPKLLLTGSTEGETSSPISAKLAGRVTAVLIQDGETVSAGQPLVVMESVELNNSVRVAQDGVNRASANYENALADYNRYQTLFQQNAVSRQTLDSMETKLRIGQADLSSAVANLSSAEQQLAYATITSPINGVVANKTVAVGQVLAPGSTLMTVENIAEVYAVVNIEQKDMGKISVGVPSEVSVDAYPGKVFQGVVSVMNPVAGNNSRMFKTKIKINNAEGSLKPGMFVKVALDMGQEQPMLTVWQKAIFQKQGLYYVYVVQDNKVMKRQVEVGLTLGDEMEIKSGLEQHVIVATSNVTQLKDGDLVQVVQ